MASFFRKRPTGDDSRQMKTNIKKVVNQLQIRQKQLKTKVNNCDDQIRFYLKNKNKRAAAGVLKTKKVLMNDMVNTTNRITNLELTLHKLDTVDSVTIQTQAMKGAGAKLSDFAEKIAPEAEEVMDQIADGISAVSDVEDVMASPDILDEQVANIPEDDLEDDIMDELAEYEAELAGTATAGPSASRVESLLDDPSSASVTSTKKIKGKKVKEDDFSDLMDDLKSI